MHVQETLSHVRTATVVNAAAIPAASHLFRFPGGLSSFRNQFRSTTYDSIFSYDDYVVIKASPTFLFIVTKCDDLRVQTMPSKVLFSRTQDHLLNPSGQS